MSFRNRFSAVKPWRLCYSTRMRLLINPSLMRATLVFMMARLALMFALGAFVLSALIFSHAVPLNVLGAEVI